jgi:HK97 family phage prohead protease
MAEIVPTVHECSTSDLEGLDRLRAVLVKSGTTDAIQNDLESDVRWKRVKFIVKEVNEDGTFEGYASVWGIVDSDAEVIDKGSCVRSLKNNPHFALLWQHKTDQPIGFAVEAAEDDYGLKLKGELILDCEVGRYAYAFLKKAQKLKGRAGLSIGFRSITKKWIEDPKTKQTHLHFTEISLMETSVVTFAANYAAYVTSVKSRFLSDEKQDTPGEQQVMSIDFDAALAARQRQRELSKHHGDIENAKYDTLSAIHGSDVDDETKKHAVTDCYMKHAKAMADWHIRSYFGDNAKSFGGEDLQQKSISNPENNAPATVKGKLSAESRANMKHALDLHDSALALHGKAMTICKEMFGGDEGGSGSAGTEMGAMSDETANTTKADEAALEVETKSEESTQGEGSQESPSETSSDSGIHSLADELAALTKSRLESL